MPLQEKLSVFLEQKINAGAYAGAAVLVDVGGEPVAEVCLGRLGAELSQRLTPDALFSLESISKVVCTAPVVLSLSERGAMGLDQPIATWLPQFRNPAKEKVTPRQILSHSSGLPDTDDVSLDPALGPKELWTRILGAEPLFPAGKKVHYSDLAYLILGRVIEIAAGKPLDLLARDLVWSPLAMTDTQFNPSPDSANRLTSNRALRGKCVDPVDRALGGVVGCDGVFSTARDLRTFGRMMLGEGVLDGKRVLKRESVKELVKDQTPFAIPDHEVSSDFEYLYSARKGLGWELPGSPYAHGGTSFSARAFGKVGGTGTFLWIDPSRDLVAIYLTNHGQPVPFGKEGWSALMSEVDSKTLFQRIGNEVRPR